MIALQRPAGSAASCRNFRQDIGEAGIVLPDLTREVGFCLNEEAAEPHLTVPGFCPPVRQRQDVKKTLPAGPKTANPWLAERITTSRREAHPDTCRKCGANILVGPDHDRVAGTARVDPNPVDEINEVVALLLGRFSYDLIGQELDLRDQWRHHSPRRHPVLLEHRCT